MKQSLHLNSEPSEASSTSLADRKFPQRLQGERLLARVGRRQAEHDLHHLLHLLYVVLMPTVAAVAMFVFRTGPGEVGRSHLLFLNHSTFWTVAFTISQGWSAS